MTEIVRLGQEVYRYTVGQVVNFESPARAMAVVEINYGTGAMALEPCATRPAGALRGLWQRFKDRVAAFVDRFEERNDPRRNP
jgi:hypothetical protein